MSSDLSIHSALDSLSQEGGRWLWKSRLRDGLYRYLPNAIVLLLALPLLALAILALGWLFGEPWKLPASVLLLGWLLPPAGYLIWNLRGIYQSQPTRRESLAVYDDVLQLKDRLQTADEFLALEEGMRTIFMHAAVEDSEEAISLASERPLDWEWGDAWTRNIGKLAGVAGLAFLLLLAALLFPSASRVRYAPEDVGAMPLAANEEDPVLLPEQEPRPGNSGEATTTPVRKTEPKPEPRPKRSSTGDPVPSKKQDAPSPELAGREKISIGDSEGGQTSQATSSGRSSQSRGTPGNQSPSTKPDDQAKPPKKKTKKPKEPKDDKDEEKKRNKKEEKSGATAGRGSSSGSSRNPASTDWSSKDRTEETDNEEFEQEEDVDDDESESEARGGLQPSLRDRRPPVNRDLSIGFGNRADPDANGRGGPGQRKKSRGVASLVLGVPVPDHVKGQPNPGRVKINQERVQPQREETPSLAAEDRGSRSGPAGELPRRTLDSSKRRVIRDYFLKIRNLSSAATAQETDPSEK